MLIILVLAIQSLIADNDRHMDFPPVAPRELLPPPERRVLNHDPLIALGGTGLYGYNLGTITRLRFGRAMMTVDASASPFNEPELPAVILASLGFSVKETAAIVGKGERTITFHIEHVLQITRETSPLPNHTKTGLARYLLTNHLYTITHCGERLGLSKAEARVITNISYGENSKVASRNLNLSSNTVDSHLHHVAERRGLHGREQVILGAFLSGEISL